MNKKFDNILDNKWWQEVAVVAFSFTIYTLKNDWMLLVLLLPYRWAFFFTSSYICMPSLTDF